MAARYRQRRPVVCCFAGDGAYANGVVLESLNWAAQAQWTNHLAGDRPFGLPIIYFIQNNHYGMTHRTDDEVMGVPPPGAARGRLRERQHARGGRQRHGRRWRCATPSRRAAAICREGKGPSSSSRARTATTATRCPTRATNTARARRRPPGGRSTRSSSCGRQLVEAGVADEAARSRRSSSGVRERNARAAVRAAQAADPDPADVLSFMYTDIAAES